MSFVIPCAIFARLSVAALLPNDEDRKPPKPALRSVRLEHRNGKRFAIATNRLVLACEFLGETDEADDAINLSLDLVHPCFEGSEHDATLNVNVVDPVSRWSVATTTNGYFHTGNATVTGDYPDWRGLIPNSVPEKPIGAISFVADELKKLADASPSGEIVLPRYYDVAQPLIVRDRVDPNWLGVFLSIDHAKQKFDPATVPDWVK